MPTASRPARVSTTPRLNTSCSSLASVAPSAARIPIDPVAILADRNGRSAVDGVGERRADNRHRRQGRRASVSSAGLTRDDRRDVYEGGRDTDWTSRDGEVKTLRRARAPRGARRCCGRALIAQ